MRLWLERFVYHRLPAPLTERAESLESRFPWRKGTGRIFRLPFTRWAIAIGRWTGEQPRENVDGIPLLTFRQLEHPEDYFHATVDKDRPSF